MTPPASPSPAPLPPSAASPAEVVRAYFDEVWNAHDLSKLDRFVADDVRYHPPRGPAKGKDGYRRMIEEFFQAFPDLRFTTEGVAESRDLVALRITLRGTHEGPWRGFAPTGRAMEVQGRPWLRVRDGRVVEVWSLWDDLEALRQLGLVDDALAGHVAGRAPT